MTERHTPKFVRASELYCVETSTAYPHPDQQASDELIAKIFDLTRNVEQQPDAIGEEL